ncbi:hypothetical protein N5J31_01435 [Acinetobacter johnsonii]|uniref:hypothetical protein n=1 Tax=Acinetobacter johnsonii TaxID=40214 RepID=UPI002446A555|nr:hypothetical protein [Acinetobacter johnsonii]MDH2045588.1 hypothetical protein [Acinetobacter johnsonii]
MKKQRTGGGPTRSRGEMLSTNINILGVIINQHPLPVHTSKIMDEIEEVGERSLSRYLSDWVNSGFVVRETKGQYALSQLGKLTFVDAVLSKRLIPH